MPVVLPPVDMPTESKVMPVVAGPEMIRLFDDQPAEIIPAPEILKFVNGYVDEELTPVVLPAA